MARVRCSQGSPMYVTTVSYETAEVVTGRSGYSLATT